MPELYADIVQQHPDIVVVYLSTGAWNTAGALGDFLARHGYPPGPLLLTDWGPTQTGWFRSGQEHKRAELRRLFRELPEVRWLLIGDDGQHDPSVYAAAAKQAPDRVLGVAIRQLSVSEQLVSTGTPRPKDDPAIPDGTAPAGVATASDGFGLGEQLRRRKLLISAAVEDRTAEP
jgi:phosphatidate phosphatase APP1